MDFGVFLKVLSPNQEEVQYATEIIMKSAEDPQFINFLFDVIQSNDSRSNPLLEKVVQLTILQIIRTKWTKYENETDQIIYWSPQQQIEISNKLFNILFSTELQKRDNIIECFRYIIIISFPNNIDFGENLINLMGMRSSSIDDVATLLNISTFWAKACASYALNELPPEILNKIENIALSMIQKFALLPLNDNNPHLFLILRCIAKCLRNFSKKLSAPFVCENFDQILSVLLNSLVIEDNGSDRNLYFLKRSVLNLFISLCSTFFSTPNNDQEIRCQYSNHFKQVIAPCLLQSLIQYVHFERDSYLLSSILYLLYLYLFYNIGDKSFLTTDFVTNIIIPVARLSPEDIAESEINPLQCIALNFSYETSPGKRTTRTATASLIGEILKEDRFIDDLYDFLLAPTKNQIDFEGRIFLMTKFVIATMTNMGPMITGDVVDALAEQTRKVGEFPPFLTTSLLMFMSSVLPFLDPELGCKIGAECIIMSDKQIVICAASKLLRKSIVECDQRVDLPITQIIPKLIELASLIKYKYITMAIEALIQMGGTAIYPYVKDTIVGLFQLCTQSLKEDNSKDCSSTLYSVFEIVNAIPDDAPILVEISEFALPACIQLFHQFPENHAYNDILLLMGAFNTKIDNVTETMISSYFEILQIIKKDEVLLQNSMDSICFLMCPIIVNSIFKGNSQLIGATVNILMYFLQVNIKEEDKDGLAYSILIIASLIQSIGDSGMAFIPHICQALSLVTDKSETCLFSACVFALSSALMVNSEKAFSMISQEAFGFILPKINENTLQTYKELKMGFYLLLKVTQLGIKEAYSSSVNLLKALCERKVENNMDLEEKMRTASELIQKQQDAEFPPLIIPFNLPSDTVDEFELFGQITKTSGLFQQLTREQQQIVREIFQ